MYDLSVLYQQLEAKRKEHQILLRNLDFVEHDDDAVDAIIHELNAVESELTHIRTKIRQVREQARQQRREQQKQEKWNLIDVPNFKNIGKFISKFLPLQKRKSA